MKEREREREKGGGSAGKKRETTRKISAVTGENGGEGRGGEGAGGKCRKVERLARCASQKCTIDQPVVRRSRAYAPPAGVHTRGPGVGRRRSAKLSQFSPSGSIDSP